MQEPRGGVTSAPGINLCRGAGAFFHSVSIDLLFISTQEEQNKNNKNNNIINCEFFLFCLRFPLARCRASLPPQLLVIRAAVSNDSAQLARCSRLVYSLQFKGPCKGSLVASTGAALHN